MTALLFLWMLFLGTVYGGYLGVLVYRLPRGFNLWTSTSMCPKCGSTLRWLDNLPIIGYVLVGGRCRFCRVPISRQYLFLELASAATIAALFLKFRFFMDEPKTLDSAVMLTLWYGFYLLILLVIVCIQRGNRQPPLGFLLIAVIIGVLGTIIPEHWLLPQCLPEVWHTSQRFYLVTLIAVSTVYSIGIVLLICCLSHHLWDAAPFHTDLIVMLISFLFFGWLAALFLLIIGGVIRFSYRGEFPLFSIIVLIGSLVWVLAVC